MNEVHMPTGPFTAIDFETTGCKSKKYCQPVSLTCQPDLSFTVTGLSVVVYSLSVSL